MGERMVCPYTVIARVQHPYTNEADTKQERGKQYDAQIDNEEWNRKCGVVRNAYSCGNGRQEWGSTGSQRQQAKRSASGMARNRVSKGLDEVF